MSRLPDTISVTYNLGYKLGKPMLSVTNDEGYN
jgi:hypothetical protein